MAQYTTTDLLTAVRYRGSIPTTTNSNNVHSTANLLLMATEELHIKLLPLIMSAREEFYATHEDQSIVSGTSEYKIPYRASGNILRDVQIITGSDIRSVGRIDPEYITTTASGEPASYYLRHNKVVLYPTPNTANQTLRLRYYLRPSRLADTSTCAQIASIDTDNNQVTVSSIPSTWSTSTDLDFVGSTAPYPTHSYDVNATNISSTTLTFSSLPTDLAVGDWLAPAEYTPIPQIPHEFMPVLVQMTVVKALEAQGDKEGATEAWKDLKTIQENALRLITPRNHGENKKVIVRHWSRGWRR